MCTEPRRCLPEGFVSFVDFDSCGERLRQAELVSPADLRILAKP